MPTKKSKSKKGAKKVVKTAKKESKCCSSESFWPLLLVIVGSVWIIEYYAKMDVPLVAVLLLVIGLFWLFKKNGNCCK